MPAHRRVALEYRPRTSMPFADTLHAAFPIQTELFSLVLACSATDYATGESIPVIRDRPDGSTAATVQLISYELIGGERQVRDIKEQEVVLVGAKPRSDPRLDAYIAGWREALLAVFESQEGAAEAQSRGLREAEALNRGPLAPRPLQARSARISSTARRRGVHRRPAVDQALRAAPRESDPPAPRVRRYDQR